MILKFETQNYKFEYDMDEHYWEFDRKVSPLYRVNQSPDLSNWMEISMNGDEHEIYDDVRIEDVFNGGILTIGWDNEIREEIIYNELNAKNFVRVIMGKNIDDNLLSDIDKFIDDNEFNNKYFYSLVCIRMLHDKFGDKVLSLISNIETIKDRM